MSSYVPDYVSSHIFRTYCPSCDLPLIFSNPEAVMRLPCPQCHATLNVDSHRHSSTKGLVWTLGVTVFLILLPCCFVVFDPENWVAPCINHVRTVLGL